MNILSFYMLLAVCAANEDSDGGGVDGWVATLAGTGTRMTEG